MATTITVGTGGDYADPASAWQGVISSNQLLIVEDYVFDIISDVTIDTASGLNTVDLGGHSITWTCSHNEANKEDWQNWYKITVASGSASGMTFSVGQGVPESITGGTFNFNYLYSVNSTVGVLAGNQTKAFVLNISDMYIKGSKGFGGSGIYIGTSQNCTYNITNAKIWNHYCGICAAASSGTNIPLTIENTTIYDTTEAGLWSRDYSGKNATMSLTLRNVVSVVSRDHQALFSYWNDKVTNHALLNCAVDDDSITTGAAGLGPWWTNYTDCIENITPADEFQSLDDTNSKFLFLKDGSFGADFVGTPLTGPAPLSVAFTDLSSVTYVGVLADGGTEPTYAGATDLVGENRPNDNGDYAIGCHEASIS